MESKIKLYKLDKPEQMATMAGVLKKHVTKHNLYTPIRDKNYVHVEGWQFAGGIMGLYPRVVAVKDLSTKDEIKWQAEVEIVHTGDDKVVSRGFAICSKKESKKASFDEYAVLSMAQTRAIGKAYRNLVGWVMKLAGYESTPSEEMTNPGEAPKATPQAKPVTKTKEAVFNCAGATKAGCPEAMIITKQELEYSKRMYGKQLCRACQKLAPKKK